MNIVYTLGALTVLLSVIVVDARLIFDVHPLASLRRVAVKARGAARHSRRI
jgi:hypothetical protein